MKKKFYAVALGRRSGIFTDWPSAEAQVKGFAGAKYKSFPSEEEAGAWLENPVYAKKEHCQNNNAPVQVLPEPRPGAIIVFTDGGCINNPGPGGYGVVIQEGPEERLEMSGGYRLTTNNRMEMTAALVALEKLRGCGAPIDLYSDSSYLVNGITKGWARKWRNNGWCKADGGVVVNVDLWQRLLLLAEALDVRFHWLKGHVGNEGNERCDKLAVSAARQPDLPVDDGYQGGAGMKGDGV
ncbi:MAG: ribonuclease HI [Proteobacteria bacterium]|nr:ribonuclease HI [Pseudomonadota bacterium]